MLNDLARFSVEIDNQTGDITVRMPATDDMIIVGENDVMQRVEKLKLVEMSKQNRFKLVTEIGKLSRSNNPVDFAAGVAFVQTNGYYHDRLHKKDF